MPTINVKTINTQNYQKIELYGSLTTKELKKKHSWRPVAEVEMGILGWRELVARWWLEYWARQQLADQVSQWLVEQAVPHLHVDKLGGATGEQDKLCHPGF